MITYNYVRTQKKCGSCLFCRRLASYLYAFYCLTDGLQQGPGVRVLVAVFIGEHVGQSLHVIIEVLLGYWFLLKTRVQKSRLVVRINSSICRVDLDSQCGEFIRSPC